MAQPSNAPVLIKPSQIDSLPFLQAEAKEQYKLGLANLWQQYENNPEGSAARQAAYDKIKTASTKLLSQLAQRNRPQSAGQPRPGSQQAGASQQQAGQNQMTPQQMQAAAQARAQQQQQQQQQQGGGGQAGQAGQVRQGQLKLSSQAQAELDSVQLAIPQEQQPRWRQQAFALLAKRDQIFAQATRLQQGMKQLQSSGQPVPQQTQMQFAEAKKAAEMATRNWRSTKLQGEGKTEEQIKQILAQEDQQRQLQQQQRMANQQGVNQQQQSQMQQQAPQQSTADSKPPAQDQQPAASPSPAQPQTGFQQQNAQNQQGTPVQNQQQQQQQPPSTQPQQQTPQTATQPQPSQAFQQPQQGMPQPQRPHVNTQMPSQMGQQQQSMPQTANQQNPQRPQVLNHQQAMSQAAATYQQKNNQGPQQGQQPAPMPNGLPFSGNQPASATQQNTPTYPNLATTQQQSATTKFPIPKQLQLDPRSQGPVAGPPSRPTLNNAGPMYHPGIQRAPPYTLEGEGDRVLSKRKLDELVRQVTGSAPASSSDSESSSVLNPDVEECILEMTDNFVDEVITSACRLAKLRPGQTLDLRDIQITLERNYGIRVPGYSLDEVRTVKKFQPAPGWTTKMQAVQTGKIVNNKDS
ncbi:hypothetical protein AC578_971 [Pseudocercospora eumusae]|uniref:Transcription initiation factor TFIID subunit 12 domain-containing protein n=1 Tax=Pseudocercospora eumusae TaxID=321146 RepID=A0A139HEH6_9PEZI|nr:hypothetical protein AC578_971 [Pseudocercospora eumusae]